MFSSYQIGFSFVVLRRLEIFFPLGYEQEVEGRRRRLSSKITASKSVEAEFVVAGDIKRSARGGCITTR